jgi:hypothetical protein
MDEDQRGPRGEFYFDAQLGLWRSTGLITWGLALFGIFSLVMGLLDFFGDDLVLAGALFTCSAVSFAGLVVVQLTGYHTSAKWYFVVPILALFFFLVLHGGFRQTGLYWCLAFTPGLLYLLGYFWGAVLWVLMTGLLALIFLTDLSPFPGGHYGATIEGRFLLAFVGLGLYSLGQDYALSRAGLYPHRP